MGETVKTESGHLHPTPSLLSKLGSIARHVEEHASADERDVDLDAARTLVQDPDVQEWMKAMDRLALLPVARKSEGSE